MHIDAREQSGKGAILLAARSRRRPQPEEPGRPGFELHVKQLKYAKKLNQLHFFTRKVRKPETKALAMEAASLFCPESDENRKQYGEGRVMASLFCAESEKTVKQYGEGRDQCWYGSEIEQN